MINSDNNRKKTVVISGGFGLLGKAIGEQLIADGFLVVLFFHETPENEIKKILSHYSSPNIFAFRCDITSATQVAELLPKIENNIGPIYAGIHCAQSPILRKKISELDSKTFKNQFEVPVFGGFNFLLGTASFLKKRRQGILIGLTTAAIERNGNKGSFGGYLTSKFALKGLLKELAIELEPYNILVRAVAPGFVAGGVNRDIPSRFVEMWREKFPNEGILTPLDIAKAISSLCLRPSDEFTVIVDGH